MSILAGRRTVTAAILIAVFLTAMDMAIIATAMPTIVGSLGGFANYQWAFSIYLLATAATTPVYGKLADIYGRKRTFLFGTGLFIAGSLLCGSAQSMSQLILYRAVQGLGAGAVWPVTSTIIGDIYALEERGKMQGIFSSVWGISAIIGPALGGFIVQFWAWPWIFWVNLPIGLLSMWMISRHYRETLSKRTRVIDYAGSVLMMASAAALMYGLSLGGSRLPWTSPLVLGLLAGALAGALAFLWWERRAQEPVLPLDIFKLRMISLACMGTFVLGGVVTATSTYVPLFIQGVLGGSPTGAGTVYMAMSAGWPIGAMLGGRMYVRHGFRATVLIGAVLLVSASLGLLWMGPGTPLPAVITDMVVMGLGFGFTMATYLVAAQNEVGWGQRGVVTATVNFLRSLGGALFIAIMGTVLNTRLLARLGDAAAGLQVVERGEGRLGLANKLLEPGARAGIPADVFSALQEGLVRGLAGVFIIMLGLTVLGLINAWFLPGGPARQRAEVTAAGQADGR